MAPGQELPTSNITQRLVDRGLAGAPSSLKKPYHVAGAIGGPIKQNKLWFYPTARYFTNESVHCRLVLPGRSGCRDPRGGQKPPGQPGHVDEGCQPAADLCPGSEAQAFRAVRLSAEAGSVLGDQRDGVAGSGTHHGLGHHSWPRSRGPTWRRAVCSSRQALRRARARTRSSPSSIEVPAFQSWSRAAASTRSRSR